MGKKGFVLCVCQGTCPSFKKMDIFTVLADVRREKIFDYVCLHPQLCVGDGEVFLEVLLAGKDTDRLYIAACDPRMQEKMFRDALDAAGKSRVKSPYNCVVECSTCGKLCPEGAIRFPDEAAFSAFIKERVSLQSAKR